jgi:hypothetical protein
MVDPSLAATLGIYRAGAAVPGHPMMTGAGAGMLYYLNGLEPPSIIPPMTTSLSNYRIIAEAALLGVQQQPRLDMSRHLQHRSQYYF